MDYKLKNLLSSTHQVLLEIIESMSEKGTWITTAELSHKLSISLRTTQRYINRLESLITTYNQSQEKGFRLEIDKKNGVRFSLDSDTDRLFLQKFIYQEDETIQLLIQLLFKRRLTRKAYCEKNYLTESSLYHSLTKVNEFLSTYNLRVATHELSLSGDESQVRIVAYSIAWILFESEKWPLVFQGVPEISVEKDAQLIMDNLNLSLNFIKKREITFSIAIALLRYRMGYPVHCQEEWRQYFPHPDQSVLSHTIEQIFLTHHIGSPEEVQFFTINMLTRSCAFESIPIKEQLVDFIQKNSIVYRATASFMKKFSEEVLPIPIDRYDSIFIFVFGSHLFAHIYDHMEFDYNANYLLEEINQNFPTYYSEMTAFSHELYQQTQATLFLESDYLIQRYFMIETFLNPNRLFGFPIKVRIETDLPEIYENTIKSFLYDLFKYDYNLTFIKNNYFQQADIVLTTVGRQQTDDNSVRFSYPLSKRDFLKIRDSLQMARQMIEYTG